LPGIPASACALFPRLKKRGSIEAGPVTGHGGLLGIIFPRLKKRGSIEA